jgi:coenzyme F420 hydrogenase subunit beta
MRPARSLNRTELVRRGLAAGTKLCTMCGLCVAVCPTGNIRLDLSKTDPRIAVGRKCNGCSLCYSVCPGRDIPLKELDEFLFGRERDLKAETLGVSSACYQAHAVDPEIRAQGASGGVATALLIYALEKGIISAAAVVAYDKNQPWRAKPVLATTRRDILGAAQSKYVVVPVNAVLAESEIKPLSGRLGCVGLPCHVHGLRMLQYRFPGHSLSRKLAFTLGIFCGTAQPMSSNESVLKNRFGVKSLDEIKSLSYRKGKGLNTCSEVVKSDGNIIRADKYVWLTPKSLLAGRCMLCWDWGAELADLSVGDFFGPAAPGSEVQLGASSLVVRTEAGKLLVAGAVEAGYIKVFPTPVEPLVRSAGFIGKKLGRAATLMACKKMGWEAPDYQYEIEPMALPDKAGLASSMSTEERERFWAERGIHALS